MSEKWIVACDESSIAKNDVARFDHLGATYAVVRMSDGVCNVMDGLCTHGKAHLAEGLSTARLLNALNTTGASMF